MYKSRMSSVPNHACIRTRKKGDLSAAPGVLLKNLFSRSQDAQDSVNATLLPW
jgi:hypothetical protein